MVTLRFPGWGATDCDGMNRAARRAGHETRLIVALEEPDSARVFDSEGALAFRAANPAWSISGEILR